MELKDRHDDRRWHICKACKKIHFEWQEGCRFQESVEEHLLFLHKMIQSMEIQMGLRVVNDYNEHA